MNKAVTTWLMILGLLVAAMIVSLGMITVRLEVKIETMKAEVLEIKEETRVAQERIKRADRLLNLLERDYP